MNLSIKVVSTKPTCISKHFMRPGTGTSPHVSGILDKVAVFLLVFLCAGAQAATLELDVMGKITRYTDAQTRIFHLSESDILAMPVHEITTSTSLTPRSIFRGISLADLLKRVGATGTTLRVLAYDDYVQYALPIADAERYNVILAYSRNGERLKLSDFGPLYIVYPRDQYPSELINSVTEAKCVRQVKSIEVQ
jgi:hypothetical protein